MDLKSMINDAKKRELSIYERFSQYDKDGSGEIDEVRRRRRRDDAAKSRVRVRRRARGRLTPRPSPLWHERCEGGGVEHDSLGRDLVVVD